MRLPKPREKSTVSIEEALQLRRSIREYSPEALDLEQVGQLLWSAYGVTTPEGFRTAPSAMTLYPLEIYLSTTLVRGLEPGIYRYDGREHELELYLAEDLRTTLYDLSFDQDALRFAPATIVFTGIYEKTYPTFGDAGRDYLHMDLGHAAENVHLQAVSLDLGTVVIAAFNREEAARALRLPENETPLYFMPVGRLK